MAALTRSEIVATLGPVDDTLIVEMIEMGTTAADLARAQAWVEEGDMLAQAGEKLEPGRMARLVEILSDLEENEQDISSANIPS